MAYVPTPADLADLKTLTGITGSTSDAILTLLLKLTGTKALNNLNLTALPADFQPVLIEMTRDVHLLLQATNGEQTQTVSSVTDGPQTVSYRDSDPVKALQTVMTVLKDYEGQLDDFRKARW